MEGIRVRTGMQHMGRSTTLKMEHPYRLLQHLFSNICRNRCH